MLSWFDWHCAVLNLMLFLSHLRQTLFQHPSFPSRFVFLPISLRAPLPPCFSRMCCLKYVGRDRAFCHPSPDQMPWFSHPLSTELLGFHGSPTQIRRNSRCQHSSQRSACSTRRLVAPQIQRRSPLFQPNTPASSNF